MTRRVRWLTTWLAPRVKTMAPRCVVDGHMPVADRKDGKAILRCSRCWAWKERAW